MRNKEELTSFIADKFRDFSQFDRDYFTTYWMDEDEDTYDDAYSEICDILDDVDWVDNGVTKLVIAFKDEPDYVFKIPFRGGMVVNEWDSPKDYIDAKDELTYPYSHANQYNVDNLLGWDYCGIEEYVYQQALDWDIGSLFADTFYLWEYDENFKVYASQKIESPGFYAGPVKFISDESRTTAQSMLESFKGSPLSSRIVGAFVEDYDTMTYQLLDFLADFKVSDLHSDNVGFDSDGHIRILDYSSFDIEELC